MVSAADQYRNVLLRFFRLQAFAQVRNGFGFDAAFAFRIGIFISDPELRAYSSTDRNGSLTRLAGTVMDSTTIEIIYFRKCATEYQVDPIDYAAVAAKIDAQLQGLQFYGTDAFVARAQEQANFRITKRITRLHAVTDDKQRTVIICSPAVRQFFEQVELHGGGILEFIHQNVANPVIEAQREIRRFGFGAERMQRRETRLGMID